MESLNLEQMEILSGGGSTGDCISQAAGGVSLIFAIAAASNPLGWIIVGISAARMVYDIAKNGPGCEDTSPYG